MFGMGIDRAARRVGNMLLSGWFLVNIVGPLVLPVFGILPLRLLPLPVNPATVRLMTTVKDGQLCWAVIAMGASMIYELWQAIEAHRPIPAWAGLDLTGIILVMLPAMVVAAGGAAFSTPLRAASSGGLAGWIAHYKVFVGSAVMAMIAVLCYTTMHFGLDQ